MKSAHERWGMGKSRRRPRKGAWIEIKLTQAIMGNGFVAPARGRGLKSPIHCRHGEAGVSPPQGGVD